MNLLPEVFFNRANGILQQSPEVKFQWIRNTAEQKTLKILKNNNKGFDIEIQCETYGLYPIVDGWHGASWDSITPGMTIEEISDDCLGFVRSLLCADSKLTVWYSNNKPYKWVLSYPINGSILNEETGSFFFNYFGRRSRIEFQNSILPVREQKN